MYYAGGRFGVGEGGGGSEGGGGIDVGMERLYCCAAAIRLLTTNVLDDGTWREACCRQVAVREQRSEDWPYVCNL